MMKARFPLARGWALRAASFALGAESAACPRRAAANEPPLASPPGMLPVPGGTFDLGDLEDFPDVREALPAKYFPDL